MLRKTSRNYVQLSHYIVYTYICMHANIATCP